ncbi:MAG TPA: hypothetical protein VK511_07545 [Gemmatimonadaceae bacterium]|nr:hypothetical protein [Gemmatimonadaceae bacterium]
MREVSIRRIRIVVAGRAIARSAARELGASFASALPAQIAALVARHQAGAVNLNAISVRVPANGTPGAMAQAVTKAVGAKMNDRVSGERR